MDQPKDVEGFPRKGVYETVTPHENLSNIRTAEFRNAPPTFCKSGK
jgi:hypothetical protein